MLLNASAFWFIGQLTLLGGIICFAMCVAAGVLTALGFRHSRKVSPHQTVLAPVVPGSLTAGSAGASDRAGGGPALGLSCAVEIPQPLGGP